MKKTTLRKLYKTALYTSPLFGIYSIAHPFIFFKSFGFNPQLERVPFEIQNEYLAALLPATFVSIVSFIIWIVNIELFRLQDKQVLKITNRTRYVLSFLLVFLLVTSIAFLSERFQQLEYDFLRLIPFIACTANNVMILLLINLTMNRDKRIELELEKTQLEITALMARHEQLRHQIHPHMLFNTLSTLKVLIKNDPELAEHFLIKLANFLRKSLDADGKHLVTVQEEVALTEDFLTLQKLRFNNSIHSEFQLSEAHLHRGKLPLFSLQILIENALKHNANSSAQVLEIEVKSKGDKIVVSNNLIQNEQLSRVEGVGLKKLKERYQLLGAEVPMIKKDLINQTFVVEINVLS